MTIHEQWKQLRKELNDIYQGIIINEYAERVGGVNPKSCPFVHLMIPAEVKVPCPYCEGEIVEQISKPTREQIGKLEDIISKYLCEVKWDCCVVQEEDHTGGNYKGRYYIIDFDVVKD